ncbi:hypothetical protein J6590_085755, partial [Homalodisca vitripennis]
MIGTVADNDISRHICIANVCSFPSNICTRLGFPAYAKHRSDIQAELKHALPLAQEQAVQVFPSGN